MTTKITIFLLSLLVLTVPITLVPNASTVFASIGMGNCQSDPDEECERQKERVGNDHSNDDDETNDEDADRDGPDESSANCWGKVTSDFTTTKDGDGGGDMSHASDPVGGDEDRETPREGVGNQMFMFLRIWLVNEGHPSDHGDTVGPQFGSDEECTQD
jgi:hypothetical protein